MRTPLLMITAVGVCCVPVSAGVQTNSPLGIGFLWTAQSQQVFSKLNRENDFVDLLLGAGNVDVFKKVKPPVKVSCIALSLEKNKERPFLGLKETIELLRKNNIPTNRVLLAYNPERHPGTPTPEMDDLLSSARRAQQMARADGAPLIIGPGMKEMMQREQLYPELAKCCDIWMLQSQRLQLDEATRKPVEIAVYREEVKRIVDSLRKGNPNIRIYVQLVTTAERTKVRLTPEQVAAFARSIEQWVDAVRIYGAPADLLAQIIDQLRGPSATASRSGQQK